MRKISKVVFIMAVALVFIAIAASCFAEPIANYEFENHSEIPKDNY